MSETETKKKRPTPWEGDRAGEATGFGGWLRREREMREVSLAEIAETTKISRSYLEALEDERFDVLPAPVFAKGFLREYAAYVGLDPDEVVNSYLTARQDGEEESAGEAPSRERVAPFEWTSGLLLAIGLVAALAVIGFVGFWAERNSSEAGPEAVVTPPAAAASTTVGSAPPPSSEPITAGGDDGSATAPADEPAALAAPLVVTLDFTEDCWVEATVDGRRRLSELHVQGEALQIEAQRVVALTLGNPGGVRIEVNGRPFEMPTFRPGRVARDIRISVDDLDAGGGRE